jgi:Uma2 family endonuclease
MVMATTTAPPATLPIVLAGYGRALMIRPDPNESPDELFDRVCRDFANKKIEQDANGDIWIMAPPGGETAHRNSDLTYQLHSWSKRDGRGRAFDSSVLFLLPDKSKRGPDASWVRNEKLSALSPSERKQFLRLVPDFVIELKSPSDTLSEQKEKMELWKRNGVTLGWLLDPEKQRAWIYRHDAGEPLAVDLPLGSQLKADHPVEGFILDLSPIWQGLGDL